MFDHFYSDPHFGHANIIGFCDRPFHSVNEMERELIRRYNATVKDSETVLWLGDSFFCKEPDAREIMQALNGRKALIKGNHDKNPARMAALGFEFVANEITFSLGGQNFRANHFPYSLGNFDRRKFETPKRRPGEILLHGHTHNREALSQENAIHCGVDAWEYAPVTAGQITALVTDGQVWAAK